MNQSQSKALIYSQGYRRYTGRRTGVAGSMRALWGYSLRNMLGIGRRAVFKIAPILIVAYAILNAVVYALIAALISIDDQPVPLGVSITSNIGSLGWLAIVIAPFTLIEDRRDGMYALYLTTPLNRLTYLFAKWAALMSALCLVSIVPGLVVLVGFTFADNGPNSVSSWLATFGRLILSGVLVSVLYAVFAMMVAALSRRALFAGIATATILWVGGGIATAIAVTGEFSPRWSLLSLPMAAQSAVAVIFDEPIGFDGDSIVGLTPQWVWLACAAHLVVPTIVVAVRYSRIGVER